MNDQSRFIARKIRSNERMPFVMSDIGWKAILRVELTPESLPLAEDVSIFIV